MRFVMQLIYICSMWKFIKYLFLIIVAGVIYTAFSDTNDCYLKDEGVWRKSMIAQSLANKALQYAKYEGASTKAVIEDFTVVSDTSATIKITAILNAKNAFGVGQKSLFTLSANVSCDGLSRMVIKEK